MTSYPVSLVHVWSRISGRSRSILGMSMSFRAQQYNPSWRCRRPCAIGGDPPGLPEDVDEPRLEMAREIEAISSYRMTARGRPLLGLSKRWNPRSQAMWRNWTVRKADCESGIWFPLSNDWQDQRHPCWIQSLWGQSSLLRLFYELPRQNGVYQLKGCHGIHPARDHDSKFIGCRDQARRPVRRTRQTRDHYGMRPLSCCTRMGSYQLNHALVSAVGLPWATEWNVDAWHEQGPHTENLHFPVLKGNLAVLDSVSRIGQWQPTKVEDWEKMPSSLEALEKLAKMIQCSGLLFLDDGENAKWLSWLSDAVFQKMTAALWRQSPQRKRIVSPKSKR